jgi:hypothetical protein
MNTPATGTEPLGVFEGETVFGAESGSVRSSVDFDPDTGEYSIERSAASRCAFPDDYHLVWRRLRGDFLVRARAEFVGEGADTHRNLGWLATASLEPGAPWVKLAVHGNGLATLTRGPGQGHGGVDKTLFSAVEAPTVIQLSRRGDIFSMAVARFGEPLRRDEFIKDDLGDEVFVGLYACSRDQEPESGRARFRDVRIVKPAPADLVPYEEYLGSHLEILDVRSGDRHIVHSVADSLQAPNWTPDGRTLIYNRNGRLYRFDLESGEARLLDTGFATNNNNDHVLSFDGQWLGISHHDAAQENQSFVYTLPATGGTPQKITDKGPSYLHGWSPDGQFLVYTALRHGSWDIYRIPATGGEEERLTNAVGLDDGSEYSPDGRHIYFNSERSGTMEIWRMRADGKRAKQLTDDEFNNWFPHVSPDGRWIVFLSFGPEVDSGDHPFYKEVYLRLLSTAGGEPRVIAYLYGGQGTINVPSWSPDSRRVAFVSNTGPI